MKRSSSTKGSPVAKPSAKTEGTVTKSSNIFPVVGIGASAGGLEAFKKLLKAIPENSGMAFVLVQHLDPKHESLLPELLQKVTSIPVLEITDDIRVQPDHIYIIPSNKMMVANDGVLLLSPRTTNKNERNLPIDLFFTSLAEVHQSHSIAVVLSGTASDGTKGLKAIKEQGGITFAQDEESAAYDGMPHSAIQAGVVDFILPPEEIPQKLLEITRIIKTNGTDDEDLPQEEEDIFRQILGLLRIRKGTDFTYYKQTTIRRRIFRRMALNKIEAPAAYLSLLRENKTEQDVLYQDLLIPVTSFFRDPKSFDNLCNSVFPQILKNKKEGDPIRIWVAGCSTGQEAYSVAICFKEFLGNRSERVQIFATDISEPAITKARTGIYTKSEVDGLTPQRLQEFFTKHNDGYQMNRQLRDMCVFASHNFLKDPPFGKLDMISCRNVLIYMEPYLQKKALTTFHYALNLTGFLMLGKSETISSVPDLFGIAHKGDKIFRCKDVPGKYVLTATRHSEKDLTDVNVNLNKRDPDNPGRSDFQKTADDIMLSKYTPAGVVVNEAMDIVHFRGKTGNYLEQLPGKPSHNLLKMAREGLAFELRNILHKAKKAKAPVIKENIPLQVNGNLQTIAIEAMPLPDTIEPHFLVLFHDDLRRESSIMSSETSNKKGSKLTAHDTQVTTQHSRIQQLEKELGQLREDMRSITEDQEAANEELQSANEELLSGSEELQSLNEELETGKEELQSTNEELTVVNQEMIGLNEQVTEARNYAETIIATLREPLLVLDKNLRVLSANKSFYNTFRVNEKETEEKLIYQLGDGQWNIPELRTLLENILPQHQSLTDYEVSTNLPEIGHRTMLVNAREIINEKGTEKLILIAFGDITERNEAEQQRKESEEKFSILADNMDNLAWIADGEGWIYWYNKRWYEYTGTNLEEMQGWGWQKVHHPEHIERVVAFVKKAWLINEPFELTFPLLGLDGEYRWFLTRASPIADANGKIIKWLGTNTDITTQIEASKKIEESEAFNRSVLENSPDCVKIIDTDGHIQYMNTNGLCIFEIDDLSQIKNKPWAELWGEENRPVVWNAIKKALQGKTAQFQAFCLTAKGTPKWWDVMVSPILQPGTDTVTNIIAVSRNITAQREFQSLLEYRKALLEAHNEASIDGILLVDAKGKILSYNKRFIDIWKMPHHIVNAKDDEAALAFAMTELVNPEQFIEKVKHLYEDPTEANTDILEFKDGKIIERHGYPVVAKDGTYYGWSWTFRDITLLKESENALRKSEEHFRQLANLIPDKITTADTLGKVNYYNQNWVNFSGLSFTELIKNGWVNTIHPDDRAEVTNKWQQAVETGTDIELELRMQDKSGAYKWHLTRTSAVKDEDGKVIKWISCMTEIQKIKEEERRKDDFLKMVSHELKTPVTSVKGYVQLLLHIIKEKQDIPSAFLETPLLRIDNQVGRLGRLISEMLDLSRLDTGKLEMDKEIFDLDELVAETIQDISFTNHSHSIQFPQSFRAKIFGDRGRIGQVIINLLNNAIKYSPENDVIVISMYPSGDDKVAVTVTDHGIGIDKEDQQRVFERFYRAGGESEKNYAGFGIGLFIAAEIIERHGGTIAVKSEKDKGSAFTFILPLSSTKQ